MSHNVTIKGLDIADLRMFGIAVADINKQYGTNFVFTQGSELPSRVWGFGDNKRRVIPGTVGVISEPSMSYDITLCKDADGKNSLQTENGMINALISKFGIDPKFALNVSTGEACNITQPTRNEQEGMRLALGTFSQHYAAAMIERAAAREGHTTRRQFDKSTGVLSVVSLVP